MITIGKVILFLYVIEGGIVQGDTYKDMEECLKVKEQLRVQTKGWFVGAICVPNAAYGVKQ